MSQFQNGVRHHFGSSLPRSVLPADFKTFIPSSLRDKMAYPVGRLYTEMDAAKRAKPMVAGWARAGIKGGGGGVVSGEGPELVQASRPRDPPPGRAPRTVAGAGGPTLAAQVTRGANPSVIRSSRLLVTFTRNAIQKREKGTRVPPPRPHLSPR